MIDLAAFMGNMLNMGFQHAYMLEKGYEYALALQIMGERKGAPITPEMMTNALNLVKSALAEAYRIYDKQQQHRKE